MEPLLTKVTRNGQVTLPAAIRRALSIEEGDYIEVSISEDKIMLTTKKLVDKSQAYFWTPDWRAAERRQVKILLPGGFRSLRMPKI